MNIWSIVGKEIRYRKTGFIIGLLCVVAAIGSLVGAVTLLQAHETRTEQILSERERETRREMERLENDYRMIMRDLGHNVLILHEDQSRASLRSSGYPDTYMPEEYVYTLTEGQIGSLNHVMPVLQEKITWPEYGLDIILTGTPGQVPVYHESKIRFLTDDGQAYRNPIVDPIPEGALRIGHAVARELGLQPGDTVELMGETFHILRVDREQGSEEDIMVWSRLDKAQQWLKRPGKINAIFALECVCSHHALGQIEEDVASVLPDVQVLEFSSRVIARAEARQRAGEEANRALAAEIRHREILGEEMRSFATILVPVVLAASGLWVFFLVLGNVRERESEIGILRAIGVKESGIVAIFLSKAVVTGVSGAVIGYLIGVAVGAAQGGISLFSMEFVQMFNPVLFLAAILIATALCVVAGWFPVMNAARKDPADVLRGDT